MLLLTNKCMSLFCDKIISYCTFKKSNYYFFLFVYSVPTFRKLKEDMLIKIADVLEEV